MCSYVYYVGDVMKESAQIALNWIRSNDHRVSEIVATYEAIRSYCLST